MAPKPVLQERKHLSKQTKPHSHLILIRHGKSEYNDLGIWTGWTDVQLHEGGRQEAKEAAKHLADIPVHIAHTSKLKRAKETYDLIAKELKLADVMLHEHEALNERNYGVYTGKNKWQVKEEVGEEEFNNIRRGWDHPTPEGETLKDVHARVVPYFEEVIKPQLLEGKNVLIAAHGNSLRALVKHLENVSDDEIPNLEIATCVVYVYKFDDKAVLIDKEIRGERENTV